MAGEKRYVVPITILGDKLNEYPLWTSANWSRSCDQATLHGTMHEIQLFCETGVAGLKPLVGRLPVGTEVELLGSGRCADMVYVRALTGKLKGEVGCIVAFALSSMKPYKKTSLHFTFGGNGGRGQRTAPTGGTRTHDS